VRRLFPKLDNLIYLSSCSIVPPTPLCILVGSRLRCSVKGVVHSVVRDLQFLGNFSHGIAFICQNKNRPDECVSGHFEPVNKPTNADASYTQLV
jgi:hypothetical protein